MALVVGSTQLASALSCFCFSPDGAEVAVCPCNHQVEIYSTSTCESSSWEKSSILEGHDQLVSGLDWGQRTGLLVSCSHDRNAFVWNKNDGKWQQQMVITRLKRAAMCVQWSPKENKFAIGSSGKVLCVGYYEHASNWWACKLIRKQHDSSIVSVAWHPNNVMVATASTDMKCRVFNCLVPGVDDDSSSSATTTSSFGDLLYEIQTDPCAWVHGVTWSPDGQYLALTSHASCVHLVGGSIRNADSFSSPQVIQTICLPGLPWKCLLFLSSAMIVGAGWDGILSAVVQTGTTSWQHCDTLELGLESSPIVSKAEPKTTPIKDGKSPNIAARLEMLRSNSSRTPLSPYSPPPPTSGGTIIDGHSNCVIGIAGPFAGQHNDATVTVTSGWDGRLIFWDTASVLGKMAQLAL